MALALTRTTSLLTHQCKAGRIMHLTTAQLSPPMSVRVKCVLPAMGYDREDDLTGFHTGSEFEYDGVTFIHKSDCRDYDWLVVYDDMPRHDVGSIRKEVEPLACPPEQTILVTAEPPTIKLYPDCYTRQFGYVLTTHDPLYLPHRNYRRGQGCLRWISGYEKRSSVFNMPEWPKSKLISTVCSDKQMKHTQHFNRYRLTKHIADNLPELEWFGWGKQPLSRKYHGLIDFKYHLAAENYVHPYHWSDKISDPILALCLTFYAGDPALAEILPEESFIPIPIDNPEAALEIITKAIRDNEYEKRLPAIREARRLIVTKYNLFSQVAEVIRSHGSPTPQEPGTGCIRGRHTLRRNPIHALEELFMLTRFRLLQRIR